MTTEDFVDFDRCPTFHAYATRYQPLRVSFYFALNDALNVALANNDPIRASERIMALATNPGIDYKGHNLYSAVVHHSYLAELLAAYVLSVESSPLQPISMKWGDFQPQSFLLPDGRLRRILLVDRWTPEREQMERFSWRTAVDTAVTGRPMVITALVIGALSEGFRTSGWTQAFAHPQNGGMRIAKRRGEFSESWKKVYRESSGKTALEWLGMMQSDGAFEDTVFSVTEDVPKNRTDVLAQMEEMAREMLASVPRQTRSACYRFTPCPFLSACATTCSPAELGWQERDGLSMLPVLSSS